VVASFKIALDDIEFGGYRIPKGWQVHCKFGLHVPNFQLHHHFLKQNNLVMQFSIVLSGVLDGRRNAHGPEHLPRAS
jgi:hypothetical protein